VEREHAARLLLEAGIHDGLLTRITEFCCRTGTASQVWLVGRWGPDEYSTVELGRGATLSEAMSVALTKPKGRRGT
jgi:hypothetical protein